MKEKYDKAKKMYADWEVRLNKYCSDLDSRDIILNAMIGPEPNGEISDFRKELWAARKKKQAYADDVASVMFTFCDGFEGYRIIDHNGIVTTNRFLTNDNVRLFKTLSKEKELALDDLAMVAVNFGANAVVGLRFDYIYADKFPILVDEGTAVTIELI